MELLINSKKVLAIFAVSLFLSGCTLDQINGSNPGNITEEDLQIASQIIAESLSNDYSGVTLSLNDALTNISSNGFLNGNTANPNYLTIQNDRSGRGNETDYTYSYNPQTGIHAISFRREVQQPLFSKSVTDTLNYIFRDNSGSFIEYPSEQSELVESIRYNSRREGSISRIGIESFFVRRDTFLIDGVSTSSDFVAIDGVHNSQGTFTLQDTESKMDRAYDLEINFLNIEIEKSPSQAGNIQHRVTGTLSWEMLIEKTTGSSSDTKTLRGTVEISGDGTALLRFHDILKLFQVNLEDGNVTDQDNEFEGRVQSVTLTNQTVTLVSGRILYLTENTEFEEEDYPSLEAVQQALNNGFPIWAEGEGYIQNNRFLVSEIEFENEGDEDSDHGGDNGEEDSSTEFEERVSSVDISANTFTLGGQVTVQINAQTIIDDDGDYQTLQDVADALNRGITVKAEGTVIQTDGDSEDGLIAVEVKFDNEDESDNDTDDNGEDSD